jgi:hypothetical protein
MAVKLITNYLIFVYQNNACRFKIFESMIAKRSIGYELACWREANKMGFFLA